MKYSVKMWNVAWNYIVYANSEREAIDKACEIFSEDCPSLAGGLITVKVMIDK